MSVAIAPDVCDRFATSYARKAARNLITDRVYATNDLEDLVQELMLALLECRDTYDPSKARWTYFVKTVIDRKSISLRRARSAEARGSTIVVASLNVLVRDQEGQLVELAQQVHQSEGGTHRGIEHHDCQATVERALNVTSVLDQLDPELVEICNLLATMSVAEAARQLGIPRTTLISRLAKIREHFVEAGLEPNA